MLVNPKNQRAKRALKQRASKLVENCKKSLVLKGTKTSQVVHTCLRNLHQLKAPNSKIFTKRNMTRPFEDQSSVEFLCKQNDTSLFAYGSHSKKRPHNLVLGRMFDWQVLDMVEFTIDANTFKPIDHFTGKRKGVVRKDTKPMFVFQGEEFESNPDFATIQSLLLDYFRGDVLTKINLSSLDHVIVCTAHKDKVFFRHYCVVFKRSGTKTPRVELEEFGPSMDLTLRRVKKASEEVRKHAMKRPKSARKKLKKNIEEGLMGRTLGRVHMKRQDLSELALAKRKALKKRKRDDDDDDSDDGNKKRK